MLKPMGSSWKGVPSLCKNKKEGEVVGSRSTEFVWDEYAYVLFSTSTAKFDIAHQLVAAWIY